MINASDKLGSIGGIKGKVTVELFNSETLIKEFETSKHNLILQKSINQLLGANLFRQLTKNFIWNGIAQRTLTDNLSRLFNGIILGEENSEPDVNEHGFWGKFVAYAGTQLFTGSSDKIGSINFSESIIDTENRKIRFVFDFATNVANTSFQSVSFVSGSLGGSFSEPASIMPVDCELLPALDMPIFNNSFLYGSTGTWASIPFMIDSVNREYYMTTLSSGSNVVRKINSDGTVTNMPNPKLANGTQCSMPSITSNAVSILGYTYIPYDTKLLKYIDGNVFTDNAIEVTMPFAISALCYIGDGKIAVTTSSTAIDSAVGERYANFIYILDLATMSILRRIRRYYSEFVYAEYRTFGKGCLFYDAEKKVLLNITSFFMGSSYPSLVPYGFAYSMLPEDEDSESIGMFKVINGFGNSYDIYGALRFSSDLLGNRLFAGLAMDNLNSSAYGTFYKYINQGNAGNKTMLMSVTTSGMSKLSRVLLPTPVTKLNTQTMKITYDLVFPEELFI